MLIVRPVEISRSVSVDELGWISEARASSEHGLLANHDYVDIRGATLDDARAAVAEENEIFVRLELGGFAADLMDEIGDELYESDGPCSAFDLGTAAAVHVLSAAGCVPISSCNGGCFGDHHSLPHPSVLLYTKKEMLTLLLSAAEETDVGVVNNDDGMIEIYADDIRKFTRFAGALIERL